MLLLLITPERDGEFGDAPAEMRRLRRRVFHERLDWEVAVSGDGEVAAVDARRPASLPQQAAGDRIQDGVGLSPPRSTVLGDGFAVLLDGRAALASPAVWESGRRTLDLAPGGANGAGGLAQAIFALAGMIAVGVSRCRTAIVAASDIRMERIRRRAASPLRRADRLRQLGTTRAVAGSLEISIEALRRVRPAGGLKGPRLGTWVVPAIA